MRASGLPPGSELLPGFQAVFVRACVSPHISLLQALARTQPTTPSLPNSGERPTHLTTCALPPLSGRDMAQVAASSSVVLGHEKEVALGLQIARFSGGWLVAG